MGYWFQGLRVWRYLGSGWLAQGTGLPPQILRCRTSWLQLDKPTEFSMHKVGSIAGSPRTEIGHFGIIWLESMCVELWAIVIWNNPSSKIFVGSQSTDHRAPPKSSLPSGYVPQSGRVLVGRNRRSPRNSHQAPMAEFGTPFLPTVNRFTKHCQFIYPDFDDDHLNFWVEKPWYTHISGG